MPRCGSVVSRGRGTALVARWPSLGPAARAGRYGVTVALPDGRRLFFLRLTSRRVLTLAGIPGARAGSPSGVVGLRADNGARPGRQTANVNAKD